MRNKEIKWNTKLAYAIGLLTSDGNLSKDGRHIEFCSKDKDLVELFCNCLELKNKIAVKGRGSLPHKNYYRVQVSDVLLYRFLLSIGLSPRKSLTLQQVFIPRYLYPDFLRGYLDGDGNINIFRHPESKHPQLRIRFSSGSLKFLTWLEHKIYELFDIYGYITALTRSFYLNYAKENSIILLNKIYYDNNLPCLVRKFQVARPFLLAGVAELVQAQALGACRATYEGSNPPARTSSRTKIMRR